MLSVERDSKKVPYLVVAGGTSAYNKHGKLRPVGPCDLRCMEKSNALIDWDQSVKFSFEDDDILILPYTDEWFYVPDGQKSPKVGEVNFKDADVRAQVVGIAKHTNVQATVVKRRKELS